MERVLRRTAPCDTQLRIEAQVKLRADTLTAAAPQPHVKHTARLDTQQQTGENVTGVC